MRDGGGRRFILDGTMARGGGGFTYLANVVRHVVRLAPDDSFRLYLRSQRLAESIPEAPNLELVRLPEAGLRGRLRFTFVEAPRLAKEWGADLYYSAGEYAPLTAPCPTIAAFRNPNVFTSLDQQWPLYQKLRLGALRGLARASAAVCDRVLFVSKDSARWIGDRLGLPERKRAVVHHGIELDRWKPSLGHPGEIGSYILSVSSIYRYKNYVRLIEAWRELASRRDDAPDLVIIGDDQDAAYSARMAAAREACGPLAERIHLLGEVPYAEVQRWYANASLFVFPSYLETFGHPLLEAMASEVPLVAADIPVFREIAADAAFYADPMSPAALAAAMEEALFLPGARELLVKRGRARVRHFTWERSARGLLALFEATLQARAAAGAARAARAPRLAHGHAWRV